MKTRSSKQDILDKVFQARYTRQVIPGKVTGKVNQARYSRQGIPGKVFQART